MRALRERRGEKDEGEMGGEKCREGRDGREGEREEWRGQGAVFTVRRRADKTL